MDFQECEVRGAYRIVRTPAEDERGNFGRVFCKREMEQRGISAGFVQSNLSVSHRRHTLRGLHCQTGAYAEEKLVCCTRGRLFDVCVDVRKDSPTYGRYAATELSEGNGVMVYIPKGCAHGFLTLEDHTQALYFVTGFYCPQAEAGFRYDDPFFSIDWPVKENLILSDKDRNWRLL